MTTIANKIKFVFFGSSRFSVVVLDELEKAGFIPVAIVTIPDKPVGRKLRLTPTPVKEWGLIRKIKILEPSKLTGPESKALIYDLKKEDCDVFIVASYGKIIPSTIIDLPSRKTLNVHPSLLPKYRGASPLQSAMLDDDKDTGVSIMRIDEKMDEGPVIAQRPVTIDQWLIYEEFEEMMARNGGRLLAEVLPKWVSGEIREMAQDHSKATYTKKIVKEDGLLDMYSPDQYSNFRKIQAFHEWPVAYFITDRGGDEKEESRDAKIRVKITSASFRDGMLIIDKVVPEGSKEMSYADFKRGYGQTR